jgi:hypothetical protein
MEYIYLIREREFKRLDEPVYKIGKTKQEPNNRLSGYPKGSEIIAVINVINCDIIETNCLRAFSHKFIQKKEYGNEYFLGDPSLMVQCIIDNATMSPKISCDEITLQSFTIKQLQQIADYFTVYVRYCKRKPAIISKLLHLSISDINTFISTQTNDTYYGECCNLEGFGEDTMGHYVNIPNDTIDTLISSAELNNSDWRNAEYIYWNKLGYKCPTCMNLNGPRSLLIKRNCFKR